MQAQVCFMEMPLPNKRYLAVANCSCCDGVACSGENSCRRCLCCWWSDRVDRHEACPRRGCCCCLEVCACCRMCCCKGVDCPRVKHNQFLAGGSALTRSEVLGCTPKSLKSTLRARGSILLVPGPHNRTEFVVAVIENDPI